MIDGRRRIVATLALAALGAPLAAAQDKKPARVAILARSALPAAELRAFRDELQALGQDEGRTYVLEPRYAGGGNERLRELAIEVARSRPDVIVAPHGEAARFAGAASATIPIVFYGGSFSVQGLATSFARPGGNLTGLSFQSDLVGKRLELLRDAVPALGRIAIVMFESRGTRVSLESLRAEAARMKIEIVEVIIGDDAGFAAAFEDAARRGAEAITYIPSPLFRARLEEMAALAARHRLPAVGDDGAFVTAGGLMAYGPDYRWIARRLAGYVDRILKGATPGDLPVEQPHEFEFAVNLKTARALDLVIPPALLARADRIIE